MTASRADGPRLPRAEDGTRAVGAIRVADTVVDPGHRATFEIPVSRLPTGTWLSLPVAVINGAGDGPRIWLSGAVHGDELNGVEIIRRILKAVDPKKLNGAITAVPIVNVFGFVDQSRYLPDRRDLNRSFPGSPRGSLASRLAHLFMEHVASPCVYGIDLHTGSDHRMNLPQIRANLHDAETHRIAGAFGAPVIVHSKVRDGSLRQAASARGIHCLLYEAGEAQRFDETSIRTGVDGVLRVLEALDMHPGPGRLPADTLESHRSTWVRARRAGIVRMGTRLGAWVRRGESLGVISDAFGDDEVAIRAPFEGLVIGLANNPLASQGDGIVHVASCTRRPHGAGG